MKNIASFLLAGLIGGFVSFGLLKNQIKSTLIVEQAPKLVQTSNQTNTVNNLPFDFVTASDKGNQAVVQIKSSQTLEKVQAERKKRKEERGYERVPFSIEDLFEGRGFDFPGFGGNTPKQGSGSGVIIGEDGLIVTNNHVVGFADDLEVTLYDGRKFKATKLGTDSSSDLALIKIEGSGFPILEFANSDDVKVGEWVLAVGNPLNYLTSTVTAGIVSAIGRDINIIKDKSGKEIEEFIQTDAAVNPGNSGGALVDTKGNLIGINTAIASQTGYYTGYSFAIPSNLVSIIVDQILENGGDIERANLGLGVRDIGELLNNDYKVDHEYGVLVDEVFNGSSAQYAGVLPGDIIVNVNGTEIYSFDELKEELKLIQVGDTVRIKVFRDGKRETIPVKIMKAG